MQFRVEIGCNQPGKSCIKNVKVSCQVRVVPATQRRCGIADLKSSSPYLTDDDQASETIGISKGCFNVRAMHTKVCRAKLDRERLPNMYESLYSTIVQFTACTCWRLEESHIRES